MSADSNSNDEVAKAQQAAKDHASVSNDDDSNTPGTIFDKIISGEWSSDKVYEDDLVLAFRDVNPQAPTHVILIPKQRQRLTQLRKAKEPDKEILGHLMLVAGQVGQKECPNGYRLVINDGPDAAQSVYHLHIHILGGRQMGWPPG